MRKIKYVCEIFRNHCLLNHFLKLISKGINLEKSKVNELMNEFFYNRTYIYN